MMKHPRVTLSVLVLCLPLLAMAQTTFMYKGKKLQTNEQTLLVRATAGEAEVQADKYLFASAREALLFAERLQAETKRENSKPYTTERPLSIYIEPSVYWLDNPDDLSIRRPRPGQGAPFGLELTLSHVRIIGLGEDPEEVILASNRGQTQGAMGNFTMLHLTGDDIITENLTFGNYCNVDLIYPRNPALSRKKRADAIVQAQLIICRGDRYVARRCHFISRLNLCPFAGAERALFEECYFECTDDALCGTGVYLNCRFTLFSSKPFYATQGTGAVMLNCDLHALTGSHQYLVKAGSPVTMVDCRWTSNSPHLFIGWTPAPTNDLRSYQQNLTLNGKPLYIDKEKPWLTVDMTDKPLLKAYKQTDKQGNTLYNVANLLHGKDGWNPTRQEAMESTPYTQLLLNRRRDTLESGVDTLYIDARPLRFATRADFKQPYNATTTVRWHLPAEDAASLDLQDLGNGRCRIVGTNQGEETRTVKLLANTPEGLEAACILQVKPRELPPPAFTEAPSITEKEGVLTADYRLDLGTRADQSLITWYRCTDKEGSNAIAVAVSRMDKPMRHYTLTAADNGYYIQASVAPKHLRSQAGEAMKAITTKAIKNIPAETARTLHTDFVNFATDRQPRLLPGFWSVDGYKPTDTNAFDWQADTTGSTWHYGRGVDGATHSYGLLQTVKGARLRYTPLPDRYGDMSLEILVDPCKPAGQGFGSATGQYLDLCIKFDTQTLTGYALRIVRTTKNDKAVDFVLMKYTDGVTTPISQPVSSICYRAGCKITLKAVGNKLTAHAENRHPLPALHKAGLTTTVELEAAIVPNEFGGVCIQHTGSTGASATLLREMEITWR